MKPSQTTYVTFLNMIFLVQRHPFELSLPPGGQYYTHIIVLRQQPDRG